MKRLLWTMISSTPLGAALALVLIVTGCSPAQTAAPAPIASPQQTILIETGKVVASAVVLPAQESRLSFVIPGVIAEMAVKEGDRVEAGQILATLSAPDLEYGLAQAEAAARSAESEYEYWIPPRLKRPPERRELAKQELVQAQMALETARAMLTQTSLSAPFAGTIVAMDAIPGEFVQPGQVVFVFARLDELKIETTDLSERDVAAVQAGQSALVYIEALDAELAGKVTAVSPLAETVGGDTVFRVTIRLDEQPQGLLWGMSAEVQISVE